ncbi:magnesium chelatase subunit D family protein [Dyadobacter sp. LHD-138]|uniref:magnesium chelatase subunit D family protein n=1 Tax=Dyadobacter sp. LHD-138 TaxID=3071413 RepID=UPI0027E15923|nr:magnesium chelatase subunit D family protein [Dyadobacter sp. LHD-138]MDQ6480270.1 magnesium chelatase subunit D family protein [Dyadobacter sp. LHD-138]
MKYPFAALVGQEKLKRALLLCAINPSIGGLLIRGEKGTAKSTAARGLAEIMPPIPKNEVLKNIQENDSQDICGECPVDIDEIPVPFVNLPLGATEDRVLGSLDLEGILSEKKKRLQPGLLATAHRGILYIDEVNLLPDHLVDVLLDVAAMGVNTIQRDGLSESHPAKFTLIGTMNPEEGNLRPQFLDRFGLMVDVEAPRDVAERTEVVRRRITFENNPDAFSAQWINNQKALQNQIKTAQKLLPDVVLPDGLLTLISQLCAELNVTSLRADIVMYKTAITLAALDKRTTVTSEDVRQAAALALVHRQRKKPFEGNSKGDNRLDELMQQEQPELQNKPQPQNQPESEEEPQMKSLLPQDDQDENQELPSSKQEQVFGINPELEAPNFKWDINPVAHQMPEGRRSQAIHTNRGPELRAIPDQSPSDIAVIATVQSAIIRDQEGFQITRNDLHQKVRKGKTGNLILFVVDASGSMAASSRMEAVKGSVLSLLTDAYQRRDMVGVISFRGVEAQLLLEPTYSVEQAEQAMQHLPTGGRTPLPHALQLAAQVISKLNPDKDLKPLLVVLSDGKANVPLPGGGDAWQQTLQLSGQLFQANIPALVLDTENDYLRFGRAAEMAKVMGAECLSLEALSSENITVTVSGRIA